MQRTIDTVLTELDNPFNYSKCFMGDSHYSQDGQLWGTNIIDITKSKTAITLVLRKKEDVHPFKTVCFIRSIDELKIKITELYNEYFIFFLNFGNVTIY